MHKSGHNKGGCVDLALQISPIADKGRRVHETENFADVLNGWPLMYIRMNIPVARGPAPSWPPPAVSAA